MKKVSTYLFMTISIIVLIFLLLMVCPWFYITQKTVSGIEAVTESKILEDLSLQDNKTNLFAFNSFKAKETLLKNPYIESVKISKKLPNTIIIEVKERKIRGYIPYMNKYLYIDDDGRVLDVQSSYTKPSPIVEGLVFNTFTLGERLQVSNDDAFNVVVELSKLMTKYEILEDIIRVNVSKPDDIHLYVNSIDVIFGDFSNSNDKISKLKEIIKKISPDDKGFLYLDNPKLDPRFVYLT